MTSRFFAAPGKFRYGTGTRYLIALLLVVIASLLRLVMAPVDGGLPYITYYPAAALAAIFGGIGPGLAVMAACVGLASSIFLPATSTFSAAVWSAVIYVIGSGVVCIAAEVMHRGLRRNVRLVAELSAARDEAERLRALSDTANQAKSMFLANMSHELRTPLNAILGFSEALTSDIFNDSCSPRCLEYIRYIHQSGSHLRNLVNDVLDLSAVEAGSVPILPRIVRLDALAVAIDRQARPSMDAKRQSFRIDLDAAPAQARIDDLRIKQVLMCLLGNAGKFTGEGGAIALKIDRAEDRSLRFAVTDNGVGMNAEQLAKALTLFGQADFAPDRRHEGLGMGLPLADRLVRLHGGRLDVDSRLGQGTTVTVTLPPHCVLEQ